MKYVPVVDRNQQPLMPTTANRAATWIKSGKATPFWKRGIFCVRLNQEPSARETQPDAPARLKNRGFVPVLSKTGKPLMPCHPARARELVRKGKAVRRFNKGIFYIKLTEREDGETQPISPGIKDFYNRVAPSATDYQRKEKRCHRMS